MELFDERIHKNEEDISTLMDKKQGHSAIYRPVTESDKSAIRSVVPGTPPSVRTMVTGGATYTPEVELYSVIVITAQDVAITIANPTQVSFESQKLLFRIKDNGTNRAISFGTQYRATTATLPTSTTTGFWTYMGFMRNATDTKFDLLAATVTA